ncbi:MAG TPA: DNA-formamidopyrimidine glycosylase family protein [Gaiellales bacterium]|nr:DNA-formamidopyrimidine glycosylase family protein [Gaiellales bacterium]
MPEGHSLEIASRRLRPLVGEAVQEGPLSGATVVSVEARGKNLLVHGDDGRSLHAHLGMHGSVRLRPAGTGRGRHVLRTAAGDAVIRGTIVRVVPSSRVRLALGPDLLKDFDAEEYLRRVRIVDRPVGEAIMDQRVLAGIGNIVKSEALWECRIDPFAPVSQLDDVRLRAVAEVSGRILREGVAAGGRLPKRIYRRAGRPCPRCGGPISSAPQGEQRRTSYWCPACCV